MSPDTLAMLLWFMLGLSIVLTLVGVAARASLPLYVASAMSFVFAIAAIFSIGIFILVLAILQFALGIAHRKHEA